MGLLSLRTRMRLSWAVATALASVAEPPAGTRIGLIDARVANGLAIIDLEGGTIDEAGGGLFDIIVVAARRREDRGEPDFTRLKTRLDQRGFILLRRRESWRRLWGRLRSRRIEDRGSLQFGAGQERREAALRKAGLYLTELTVVPGSGKRDHWILASIRPLEDHRFRDHIGRVATDYLR